MNKLRLNNEETNGFFIYSTDNDEHFEKKDTDASKRN